MSFDPRATYAKAAAVHATGALARLLGCAEPKQAPELSLVPLTELEERVAVTDEGLLAVFADLNGSVTGQAGIVLSLAAATELLAGLVGEQPEDGLAGRAGSALCEAGNIAISAASGALGYLTGGVVVPSVPRLARSLAEVLDPQRLPAGPRRDAHTTFLVESLLGEPGAEVRVCFVWIPATS